MTFFFVVKFNSGIVREVTCHHHCTTFDPNYCSIHGKVWRAREIWSTLSLLIRQFGHYILKTYLLLLLKYKLWIKGIRQSPVKIIRILPNFTSDDSSVPKRRLLSSQTTTPQFLKPLQHQEVRNFHPGNLTNLQTVLIDWGNSFTRIIFTRLSWEEKLWLVQVAN